MQFTGTGEGAADFQFPNGSNDQASDQSERNYSVAPSQAGETSKPRAKMARFLAFELHTRRLH